METGFRTHKLHMKMIIVLVITGLSLMILRFCIFL